MPSEEIKAMGTIDEALAKVKDNAAIERILRWAVDKYKVEGLDFQKGSSGTGGGEVETPGNMGQQIPPATENEIPGIAMYNGDDKITFTFQDIKAKNARDAAVRLALVTCHVYKHFTGKDEMPRAKILTPLLKSWRLTSGSVVGAIADHRGIISEGGKKNSTLKLDFHAKKDAKTVIEEILNKDVAGKWKPKTTIKKSKKKSSKKRAKKKS